METTKRNVKEQLIDFCNQWGIGSGEISLLTETDDDFDDEVEFSYGSSKQKGEEQA